MGSAARWRIEPIDRFRLGSSPASIRAFEEASGGVRPAVRHRSVRHLSLVEREEISRGVAASESLRVLARRFGRAPSTLSREVARNGGRHRYRAHRADRAAWQRSRRAKPYRLASNHALRAIVEEVVADRWSPQQIASWLARTHPDDVPWMRAAANANWKEVRGGVRPNAQSFPSSAYVAGRRLARSDISCEQWTTRASARVASGPRTRCRALTAAAPTLPPRRGSALTPPNQKRERISEPLSV